MLNLYTNSFTSNWCILYTYHTHVLIQIGREPLRRKPLRIYSSSLISLKVLFYSNRCKFLYESTFSRSNAVYKLILTLSLSLLKKQLRFIQNYFKIDYLFLAFSVATDLVTSLTVPIQSAVLLFCVDLAIYWRVPYSLISFMSASLLQALLQASTKLLQNALLKMKKQ